jgi:polyphosphate kinase 2
VDDKYYAKQLRKLQCELVAVQEWVKDTGQRIIIVFEGRDAAGKGGIIKAITSRVSSRVFRVVALPAPSDREKSQLYLQRYIQQFPAAGEVVIFDRSWYNRAGVEKVMGFCTEEETERFLKGTPDFERRIVEDGIILLKYWLEVSNKEQEKRFKDRIRRHDKQWKLSGMDLEARRRWYDYSRARDAMFEATDTDDSPWHVVRSDDKKQAHLNCISHLLEQIPYQPLGTTIITLPKRDKTSAYDDDELMQSRRYVPENFFYEE